MFFIERILDQKYIFLLHNMIITCRTIFHACTRLTHIEIQTYKNNMEQNNTYLYIGSTHVICYRVKSTQRNYCIFRGRSPGSFGCSVEMSNRERERSTIAPKLRLIVYGTKKRSNIMESKNERDARDAVSPENRCIYL